MKIIGITGGTGCGKTTALNCLAHRGARLIDCDEVYHRLLETDMALLDRIEARFPGVVTDHVLDRKRLGSRVFSDPAELTALNGLISDAVLTAVRAELSAAERDNAPAAAIDAIGLVESGLGALCHVTVAVTAPEEERVLRLMRREEITEEYARLRIAAQKSNEEFSAMCDETLCNDCPTAEAFAARCEALFDRILENTAPEPFSI